MDQLKKTARIFFKFWLALMLFVVVIALLIQLPPVQNFLTGKIETYLQNTLKTEVKIGGIYLDLPENLVIENVYVEDLQKDTLISVGELSLNFKLNKLWSKKIQLDAVSLIDGTAKIHFAGDSSNLDFITSAFGGEPDTTASDPIVAEDSTGQWTATFFDTNIDFQNINFEFTDEKAAIDLRGKVGVLEGNLEELDYQKNIYKINRLGLLNSQIKMVNGEPLEEKIEDGSEMDYLIETGAINLQNVLLDLKTTDSEIIADIQKLENRESVFKLKTDDIQVDVPYILLTESAFKFNIFDAPVLQSGFDAGHVDFQKIKFEVADLKYHNLDVTADIRQLSAKEKSGVDLKNLKTLVNFSEENLELENLSIQTDQTEISSEKTQIGYPFLSEKEVPLDVLKINSDMRLDAKNLKDLRYFYAGLDDIAFFKNHPNTPLKIRADLSGSMKKLNITKFDFEGLKTRIKMSGTIANATDTERLKMNLQLQKLEAKGKDIAPFIPKGSLPDYIQLPDDIQLSGKINGSIKDFSTAFVGETRRATAPSPTKINISGNFKNLTDWNNAFLDISLDTFFTTRADLLAYIPPGTIPEYVRLPDRFVLGGTIVGKTNDLKSNLELLTYRDDDRNRFEAIGTISGLFTNEDPVFDLKLNVASISRRELAAFMPDSLLPAYFRLPIIEKLTGVVKGDLNNFNTNFRLESNTGNWSVNAKKNKETYQLDLGVTQIDPKVFFTENYLDSLTGINFVPFSIDIKLEGNGFDLSNKTFADFEVIIRSAVDTSGSGLVIKGKLNDQTLTARAFAEERFVDLKSEILLDYTKAIPKLIADLQLNKLDLQSLGLSEVPFALAGNLKTELKGTSLDTLSGNVSIKDFGVRYEKNYQRFDSLLLTAKLDKGDNLVEITSDLMDAKLEGQFRLPETANIIESHVMNYFQPDTLVQKSKDRLSFSVDWHRPEFLTMGFVPGLTGMTPFSLSGKFDNRDRLMKVDANFPYFKYTEAEADTLIFRATGKENAADYQINIEKIDYGTTAQVENFKSFGDLKKSILSNSTLIFDSKNKERFVVNSSVNFSEKEKIKFSLSPDQLLNYEKWNMSAGNQISVVDKDLSIKNWRLFKDQRSIELIERGGENFDVLFEKFDLKLISEIIAYEGNYLGGILNGKLSVQNPLEEPTFTAGLDIENLELYDALLGNLDLNVRNESQNLFQTNIALLGNGNNLSLSGKYNINDPIDPLNAKLDITSLNMASIEPLTFGNLKKMEGTMSGNLKVTGSIDAPTPIGEIRFEKTAFDVNILNTRMRLGNEPVVFDANAIEFKNLKIYDATGSTGVVSSYILTSDYRDFYLQTEIEVNDFLVLNTTVQENEIYYGKLLTDAKVLLKGNLDEPTVEVTAKAKKGSDLTYVYTSGSTEIESYQGVVEFITPEILPGRSDESEEQLFEVSDELNMKIIVKIEIDDDLNFKLITDPLTGDYFEGKAKGNLVYVQNPDGTMELNGGLEMIEGEYLFSYQKVIRRPFQVQPGGTVRWTGDPTNPEFDINALYEVRTSPFPLLAKRSSEDAAAAEIGTNQKQTFNVVMNISGTPVKTEIGTTINYPKISANTNNAEVQAAIDRINQDANRQNTQAFSLILFNGFIAQNLEQTDATLVDVTGNLNKIISRQLNNLANQYVKFVEIDFGLDTYENSANSSQTDFRVSVRKRFLNDRLTVSLDGKTSTETGADESSSQAYLDNVTVEYALTPTGQYRVKIYNKREFDDFIGGTGVKIGGALVFSKDFEGVQFFPRKRD